MAQKLSNLPNRALIKFGKHQIGSETAVPIIWMVADKNHSGYPTNSVTLITEKIIDIRPYDAKEGSSKNPDYKLSNINQWLNSSASAGNWYAATHSNDVPPSTGNNAYSARPGFLYNFTAAERLKLLPTTLTVQTDEDDEEQTITANVFLPSEKEILGKSDFTYGSRLACFTSGEVRAYVTSQVFSNSYSGSLPATINDLHSYFTRTIYDGDIYVISDSGGSAIASPYNTSMGIRPMINLPSDLKISSTTDADGCYTVLTQAAPVISGSNTNLGTKSVGFSHTYSVTDTDKDENGNAEAVTITEYIDNVQVRAYVATLGQTNTFAVTGNTWLKLSNGSHTLKITAADGFDTATRTITFAKSVTKLVAQRTTPITATTMPTRIVVTLVKNVPSNSSVKVEVCNNGFDTTPTWENFETYASGLAHTFSNNKNTAGKWGVNIRVTVDRGQGEGACYISEIGGNFE